MFRAVREWWGSGRGRHALRLFAFEFIVVMVGVLAAQALQNWGAHRSALGQMEEARARARRQLSADLVNVLAWKKAVPCLDQRMVEIMRATAKGSLDRNMAQRPSLATFVPIRMDDQSELLLRARYGNAEGDAFTAIAGDIDHAAYDIGTVVHSWGRLNLADPALGPINQFDRNEVRSAAADIRAELRGLDLALGDVVERSAAIGVHPGPGLDGRPINDCAEMWRAGSITIPR